VSQIESGGTLPTPGGHAHVELNCAGDPRYGPSPVGFSIKKTGSKTCSLVEKSSAGDQWLTSLVGKPRLSRSYTGAGWLVA
jgi:hypothetical protein